MMKKWDLVIPCETDKVNGALNVNDILLYDFTDIEDEDFQLVKDKIDLTLNNFRYLFKDKLLTIKQTKFNDNLDELFVICHKDENFDIVQTMMFDLNLIPTMFNYINNKHDSINCWIAISVDNNRKVISPFAIWFKDKQTCKDVYTALSHLQDIGVS